MTSKVLKVPASEKMLEDLEELKRAFGTTSAAEAIRRAVANEIVLRRHLKKVRSLKLRGDNEEGEEVEAIIA